MRITEKFKYCEIQTEEVEISPGRYEEVGVDFRSLPVDSEVDRVCCRCGNSLSADKRCDYCDSEWQVSEWRCVKCEIWNNEYRTECRRQCCNGKRADSDKWRVHYKSGVTVEL